MQEKFSKITLETNNLTKGNLESCGCDPRYFIKGQAKTTGFYPTNESADC